MRNKSLALVRGLRSQSVRRPAAPWFDPLESLALNSGGRRFTREDLHDRRGARD